MTIDQIYSENQILSVLNRLGIQIIGDTYTNFLCLCVFHGNTDTAAFSIDKRKAIWMCFNPSCGQSGNLHDLVRRIKKFKSEFQVIRFIADSKEDDSSSLYDRLMMIKNVSDDMPTFDQDVLDRMHKDFWESPGHTYMSGRHFEDATLDHFQIGYSRKKNMVVVPMHDEYGVPVGIVGRSIEGKSFKNSVNLPKSRTIFNIHRAKQSGDTLILVEASFDAMRVHQAGYPNVGALLGGHVTQAHADQINKIFNKVIIMTDFDPLQYRPNCRLCDYKPCVGHRPGRVLGHSIANILPTKKIFWAAYSDKEVYPHGAKDPGDMTDDEIRHTLRNSISNFEYQKWRPEAIAS